MRILRVMALALATPCLALAIGITPLAAADRPIDRLPDDFTDDGKAIYYPILTPKPIAQWEGQFGARYFPSSGKTKLNLYNAPPGNILVSRLTFSNLIAHSGELFGKVEHLSGFFVKGYVGGGALNSGNLQDEDFLLRGGYSSTDSQQRDGQLRYGTLDAGYEWRSENLRLGFFAGYFYYSDSLNAFGCVQTATNPTCRDDPTPPIPSSVNVISRQTTWNAIRLGGNTTWIFGNGLSLMTEFAWLPYATLSTSDFHWFSNIIRPVHETAVAVFNVQLEALLNYQFSPNFAAGIGARYWRIGSDGKSGEAYFPDPQSINSRTERYGGFVQASYKFGDLRPSRY